jgi:hypothetical protein
LRVDSEPTPEERSLWVTVVAMERLRSLLLRSGDLATLAEVNGWFRQHAPAIRAIRDKMEPW